MPVETCRKFIASMLKKSHKKSIENNTRCKQAILLGQYSFICVQYFKCSDT